ncbi:MAG: hypothetical protein KC435_02910 [Thermomicrobiales bacterium]|nr:hypothetical protein [Thermomicrobiales bacterium]
MTTGIKISAADLGTNTLKVTHATLLPDGELAQMLHASDTVRLGYGIEATGRIEQQRFDACLAFLREQEAVGREYGVEAFIGVATEALRIAENGADLLERIANETSWQIEIISGVREAELTYLGLKDDVPSGVDCAIVDIGGGSTEAVIIRNGNVTNQQSLPIGSGRLADRFFRSDPPGEGAVREAIVASTGAVSLLEDSDAPVHFLMLAGGSGLFMNQLIAQLWGEPPFDLATLQKLGDHLADVQAEDTVNRIGIPLARAQVLPGSVAVAIAVMQRLRSGFAAGVPSGIRMGLIREYGEKR